MAIFVITTLFIGLVIAAMAIGVIMGREPIKGSCGGMGALGIDTKCDICGGNPQKCEEETRGGESSGVDKKLFYAADNKK